MIDTIISLDIKLFYLINGARTSYLDKILPLFSQETFLFLFYIFLFLLVAFLYFRERKLKLKKYLFLILFFILGFGFSDFSCGKIFKPIFQRERPFACLPGVYYYSKDHFRFVETPLTYKKTLSFPSCHAGNAGFGSTFLSFLKPSLSPLTILFALLVGYSRIYLGHHFPLDVFGGYILGFLIGFIFYRVWKQI